MADTTAVLERSADELATTAAALQRAATELHASSKLVGTGSAGQLAAAAQSVQRAAERTVLAALNARAVAERLAVLSEARAE